MNVHDQETLEMIATQRQSLDAMERVIKSRNEMSPERPNPLFPRTGPVPPQMPPFPRASVPGKPSQTPPATNTEAIERWKEILFRPSMASAMLYVLMPVIEQISRRFHSGDELMLGEAVNQLDTWERLTVAQRTALNDLFTWVNGQLEAEQSVIPQSILANIAAATADYDVPNPS